VTPLGQNFAPGPYDVICARGKQAWNHTGNTFFRLLVEKRVEEYSKCSTKVERSLIVTDIVETIRTRGNGFVKAKDPHQRYDGWIEVGDLLAREKTGSLFRNALSTRYKSSVKSKKIRKTEKNPKLFEDVQQVVLSNKDIRCILKNVISLTHRVDFVDRDAAIAFNQANIMILDSIKRDKTLVRRFRDAVAAPAEQSSDDEAVSLKNNDIYY
jgi:hypothetical protein